MNCLPKVGSAHFCILYKKHFTCHVINVQAAWFYITNTFPPPLTDLNPKQHVPLEEYAANLKSMVQYLKSIDIAEDRIILITPPPLQESAWEKECLAKGKCIWAEFPIFSPRVQVSEHRRSVLCWCQSAFVCFELMGTDCSLVLHVSWMSTWNNSD